MGICCVEGPEKEWDSCRDVERSKAELFWGSFFRNTWLWVSQRSSRTSSCDFAVGWVSLRFFRSLPLPLAVCAGAAEAGSRGHRAASASKQYLAAAFSGCPSGLGVALPSCSSSSHKSRKSWELRIWAAGSVSRGPPPWSLNLWPVMFELRASAPGNPQSSCWSLRWCLLFLPDQERHTCWSHSTVSLFCCSLSYHHRRRI